MRSIQAPGQGGPKRKSLALPGLPPRTRLVAWKERECLHPGGGLWPLLLISFATSDSTIKQAGALSSPGSHELDWDEVDATALEMLRGGGVDRAAGLCRHASRAEGWRAHESWEWRRLVSRWSPRPQRSHPEGERELATARRLRWERERGHETAKSRQQAEKKCWSFAPWRRSGCGR